MSGMAGCEAGGSGKEGGGGVARGRGCRRGRARARGGSGRGARRCRRSERGSRRGGRRGRAGPAPARACGRSAPARGRERAAWAGRRWRRWPARAARARGVEGCGGARSELDPDGRGDTGGIRSLAPVQGGGALREIWIRGIAVSVILLHLAAWLDARQRERCPRHKSILVPRAGAPGSSI